MKKSSATKVYLAGNMAGLTDEEMRGWRNQLKASDISITWLDPCDRTYRPQQWRQLVEDDLADVLAADFIVAYITMPGIGTSMELVHAGFAKIPRIVVVPDFRYVSPWVRYHADYLVETFDHAIKIIKAEGGVL